MAKISIDLIIEDKNWKSNKDINKKLMKDIFTLVLDYLNIKTKNTIEFSITLSDDEYIKELNNQYRKKNKETNVLTFSLYENKGEAIKNLEALPHILLGDIIFSFETVKKESEEQNKTFLDHFTHLLIHSYLHLFSYDHIEKDEEAEMENIEIEILKTLNIKNPYLI